MANVNKVILIGNVTRDPEVKYTPKGQAVAEVGLAVNRVYTIDGEKREETTFVDVEVWGRTAELAGQYLSKGRPVYFEGRLKLDSWEDKTSGQKRSKLRVVGETMQFLGGKGDGGGGGGGGGSRSSASEDYDDGPAASPPPRSSRPAPGPSRQAPPAMDDEDDIPF